MTFSRTIRVQDFRDLKVWQKAHSLTLAVYQETAKFPGDERFGLTIQLRRSASTIPTSIADGCGRSTDTEFWKLLSAAMGSGSQLEYQLLLAKDLGYLPDDTCTRLTADLIEIKKMMNGLLQNMHS
jgi:four helix bundle protein